MKKEKGGGYDEIEIMKRKHEGVYSFLRVGNVLYTHVEVFIIPSFIPIRMRN